MARELTAKQRGEMAELQSEIHQHMATRIEALDRAEIEVLSELPDEIKMVIANRETRRVLHSRQLRESLGDLLPVEALKEYSQQIMQGSDEINIMSELKIILSPKLREREEHLTRALDSACSGTAKWSMQQAHSKNAAWWAHWWIFFRPSVRSCVRADSY